MGERGRFFLVFRPESGLIRHELAVGERGELTNAALCGLPFAGADTVEGPIGLQYEAATVCEECAAKTAQ